MATDLKRGDHVEWNSEAGRVRGTIQKKVTREIVFKGYKRHASEEEPQYIIKSDKTDHLDWDRDARQLSASEDYCWYSWPQQAESMARLAAYRFEWVLPGHGQRVHLPADEMRQQIERLAEAMRERSQV